MAWADTEPASISRSDSSHGRRRRSIRAIVAHRGLLHSAAWAASLRLRSLDCAQPNLSGRFPDSAPYRRAAERDDVVLARLPNRVSKLPPKLDIGQEQAAGAEEPRQRDPDRHRGRVLSRRARAARDQDPAQHDRAAEVNARSG